MSEHLERVFQWLRDHEQELLEDTRRMLQIPSIESDPEPNAPFGRANREALDFALSLGDKWGMETRDIEGYIGYAEVGSGEKLIMSLGHLDVVPVGPGWKHEPFGAGVEEGYIYARGATDDKGPTMASFYAVRALRECIPDLPARIRQVFGCNEESGFKCVARYVQTEEPPTYGVAPDSGWPLYHAEKGIANIELAVPLPSSEFALLEANGGQRTNIVIDRCEARVRVAAGAKAHVESKLQDAWDKNVEWTWEQPDVLHVIASGKAAHGSTPFYGDSAGIRLFRFLIDLAPLGSENFYEEVFDSMHVSGVGIGIHGRDDVSKDLTCNIGIIRTQEGRLHGTYNVRYPVTWEGEELRNRCLEHIGKLESGWEMVSFSDSPSLYFPLEHPMVKVITEVHEQETGEKKEPGVMGGGTYARAIPNTVSIGTGWDGDGKAHETDERLKVENLYKMSRIYAHILYRLAHL
jgi:succinyl-diaminopimelate desuccinylase